LELSALYRIRHYWLQRSQRWQLLVSSVTLPFFDTVAVGFHPFHGPAQRLSRRTNPLPTLMPQRYANSIKL
jgi:hypothetical protein